MLASTEFPVFVKLMAHYKQFINQGAKGVFGEQPKQPGGDNEVIPEPEDI